MDQVTIALLEASRKLTNPKQSTSSTPNTCSDIPNLTVSAPQATTNTTNSSASLLSTSSPINSSVESPNNSFASDSVASSPTNPSFLNSWFGGIQRIRSVSESHVTAGTKVKVNLSPWLAEGNNARDLKVARVRRNSVKEMEEAMAGGLSSADMYMPPM